MADQRDLYLPPEYQQQLDEANRMQQMALMLSKQAPAWPQGQMVGGYYIKPSNVQYLANTITNQQNNMMMNQAIAQRQAVVNRYLRDQQRAKEQVVGMTLPKDQELSGPPAVGETMGYEKVAPNLVAAERAAQASPFPEVQALAKSIALERMKVFDEAAKTSTAASVQKAAAAGGDPRLLEKNTYNGPQIKDIPGVGIVAEWRDERGNMHQTAIQRPAAPPLQKFGWEEISSGIKSLEKERVDIFPLQAVQRNLLEAYSLIKSGALNTGALAGEVTALKALAARIPGLPQPDPSVPASQYFRNVVVPELARTLREVRGSGAQSNTEFKAGLERSLDIDKDPRAIEAMIVHGIRGAQFGLKDYNDRVRSLAGLAQRHEVDPEFVTRQGVGGGLDMNEAQARALFPDLRDEQGNLIFPDTGGKFNPQGFFKDQEQPPPAGSQRQRAINQPKRYPQ